MQTLLNARRRASFIVLPLMSLGMLGGCAAEEPDDQTVFHVSPKTIEAPQTTPARPLETSPAPPQNLPLLLADQIDGNEGSAKLHFSAEGDFFYGPAKGYIQTPAGGAPASTSHNRPRLGELGIHDAYIGRATLAGMWDRNELFGGAEIIRLSGSDTLREDLTTHGTTFAAGTSVSSDVSLDWYRFGYRYHLNFFPTENDAPQLLLAPYADGVIWNFSYNVRGGGDRASRAYIKPSGQVGMQAAWSPGGGRFSLNADLSASPPGISSLPFIAAEQIDARYRFIETMHFSLSGLLGVRMEEINFHDHQRVPNHIRADLGPLGVVGVVVGF
jgi:hypothetical protein